MTRKQDKEGTGEARQNTPSISEKQRRELWLYLAVSITAVELLLATGALLFSFINLPGAQSGGGLSFPWLTWGALSLVMPALILLLAHSADIGLFRAPGGAGSEQEWQKLLPARMQKFYRVIKGAPVVAVLVGVAAIGAAMLTIDGALSALGRFSAALMPHLPVLIGGLAGVAAVIVMAAVWLNYRTRRLIAEYEFRREVLEKTGVIIVDKGSTPLPPGGVGDVPFAIVAGEEAMPAALPAGHEAPDAAAESKVNSSMQSSGL